MKTVLLFGAGKSATVLIEYLLNNAAKENWQLQLVDANASLAQAKLGSSTYGKAISFDITDLQEREKYITGADIVISLLPPALHHLIAESCVAMGKNLLTASYVDDKMRSMQKAIDEKGLLFLCEMGLDPGIDHMSAMQLIDHIKEQGGHIHSFRSHCGGLVAPESDDNPWHYKISWNPRNIVLAGKAGAIYRENGKEKQLDYEGIFDAAEIVHVPEMGVWAWYANRDSLGYASLYGLTDTPTLIRTTLRHPAFIQGWKNIIELGLTDEQPAYHTKGRKLLEVFKQHMDKHHFAEWIQSKIAGSVSRSHEMLEMLTQIERAQEEAAISGEEDADSFMIAGPDGNIEEKKVDEIKTDAADYVAGSLQATNLILQQLFFLGLDDDQTELPDAYWSPADLLQFAMEKKLMLGSQDKDMVIMLHEFDYELNGAAHRLNSSLVAIGKDQLHTAMAKTVGLPLGIATKLVLNGSISRTGLCIPIHKDIYHPVLEELKEHGIHFREERETIK